MMDFQTMVTNALAAGRAEDLKKMPVLTLGEIIAKLEGILSKGDGGRRVRYDFEYLTPTTLDSWRGVYAELALGFQIEGSGPTVKELLEELKSAIGKTFVGYKGGDYVMGRQTPVWVANYGNAGSTAIVAVEANEYKVILRTLDIED
jgi:hypothetical protein